MANSNSSSSRKNEPSLGDWEKHTKGIGKKILGKFGFNGRLGAKETGISTAIQVKTQLNSVGLGFGSVKEDSSSRDHGRVDPLSAPGPRGRDSNTSRSSQSKRSNKRSSASHSTIFDEDVIASSDLPANDEVSELSMSSATKRLGAEILFNISASRQDDYMFIVNARKRVATLDGYNKRRKVELSGCSEELQSNRDKHTALSQLIVQLVAQSNLIASTTTLYSSTAILDSYESAEKLSTRLLGDTETSIIRLLELHEAFPTESEHFQVFSSIQHCLNFYFKFISHLKKQALPAFDELDNDMVDEKSTSSNRLITKALVEFSAAFARILKSVYKADANVGMSNSSTENVVVKLLRSWCRQELIPTLNALFEDLDHPSISSIAKNIYLSMLTLLPDLAPYFIEEVIYPRIKAIIELFRPTIIFQELSCYAPWIDIAFYRGSSLQDLLAKRLSRYLSSKQLTEIDISITAAKAYLGETRFAELQQNIILPKFIYWIRQIGFQNATSMDMALFSQTLSLFAVADQSLICAGELLRLWLLHLLAWLSSNPTMSDIESWYLAWKECFRLVGMTQGRNTYLKHALTVISAWKADASTLTNESTANMLNALKQEDYFLLKKRTATFR
jgi:hypothetical protein